MSVLRSAFRSLSFRTVCALWSVLFIAAMLQVRAFHEFFSWDAMGYYAYLPATFLHGDPTLQDFAWLDAMRLKYGLSSTLYQVSDLPDGHRLVKYPIGLAVTWAPWFLFGHAAALITGHEADGFSTPYQWAVRTGVLVYVLFGLLALRRVLLHRFNERVTASTIVALLLGTNLLAHVVDGLSMVHITNFVLYAGILLFTLRWIGSGSWKDAMALAVLMGLQGLTRASELLCVLLPLLWMWNDGRWRARPWHFVRQWSMVAIVMFLIGLPQFLLWHHVTGHWFVDTYNNAGEGFDLLAPHTFEFLFSFRKGWFVYTPLMMLVVVALFTGLRKRWPASFPPILVFFILSLHLISSWTCWWYASSFGQRAMVGLYPVLAIPLAVVVEYAITQRTWKGRMLLFSILACVVLNIFQYWQYTERILDRSRMTRAAYLAILGRTERVADIDGLLSLDRARAYEEGRPDTTRYARLELPAHLAPVPANGAVALIDTVGAPFPASTLDEASPFTQAWSVPFGAITAHDHLWVEARWRVFIPADMPRASFVTAMQHDGKDYGYQAIDLDTTIIRNGRWNTITTWYLTPDVRNARDLVRAYAWHRGGGAVILAPPHIILHQPIVLP